MMSQEKNITTFEEFLGQQYGPKGSPGRLEYERGFELFMIGVSICQEREKQGITQEQLAKKCGITRSVVDKVEMDAENVKVDVLRNIIENGLGGRLELSVHFDINRSEELS